MNHASITYQCPFQVNRISTRNFKTLRSFHSYYILIEVPVNPILKGFCTDLSLIRKIIIRVGEFFLETFHTTSKYSNHSYIGFQGTKHFGKEKVSLN